MPEEFGNALSADDILLVSYPKSGNTWVRFILANIISLIEMNGREVDYQFLNGPLDANLDINDFGELRFWCIPRFVKTHKENKESVFGGNKSVYILRNPGDTMVSFYEYRRGMRDGLPTYTTISDFIRDEEYGIDAWSRHITSWSGSATVYLTYEMLKADPVGSISDMFRLLDVPGIPESIVREAIRRSDFKSVRELEEKKGLDGKALEVHVPGFRFARDGSVGQWIKYFEEKDIIYINRRLHTHGLDAFQLKPESAHLGISESLLLDRAQQLLRREEWMRSAKALEQLTANRTEQSETLSLLTAQAYDRLGETKEAVSVSKQIPADSKFFSLVDELNAKAKSLSRSKRARTIINVRKLIADEKFGDALDEIKQTRSHRNSAELLYLSGLCHYRKGDIRDAVLMLRQAISKDSDYLPARELLNEITSRYDLCDDYSAKNSGTRSPVSPLTGSDRVTRVRSVDTSYLIGEYKKRYQIDTEPFFKNRENVDLYKCLDTGFRFYYPIDLTGDTPFFNEINLKSSYESDWQWVWDIVSRIIQNDRRVLELGYGNSGFVNHFKQAGIEVEELELQEKPVSKSSDSVSEDVSNDIEMYASSHKAAYDVVCSFGDMEHIARPIPLLKAAVDMIKPGGILLLGVHNHHSLFGLDHHNPLDMPPYRMGLWNEYAMKKLGNVTGLSLKKLHIEHLQESHLERAIEIMQSKTSNDLGLHEAVAGFLSKNHKKVKGFKIVGEFQKPEDK